MDLLEIAITKQLVGGGGGSGTDNYNELSNQPKINDVTLSGNKTASALGLQNEINSENLLDADLVDDTEADNKFVTSAQMLEWSGKQDKLTFDNVPTSESNNPVKSGGIYIALAGKENSLSANSAAYKDYETTFSANSNDKIPTSKSISDNVADNAKLTNYQAGAGTSFQTIDPTSDKVTDAIEKVQNNALFNKTNILYVADNIGKNILENKNYAVGSVGEHNGFRFTTLSDGGIKIESIGTHSANGDYYMQGKWSNTETSLDLTNKTYVASLKATATIASGGVRLRFFSSGNTQIGDYIGTNSSAELTGAVTIVMISAMATATLPSGGIIVYPMVCTTDAWNISHEFTPYALPNYDLTRLEAEDRASLAEVVDSGAKNVWDFANISNGNWHATTSKTDTSFSITSTGIRAYFSMWQSLPAGTYMFSANISNRRGNDYTVIAFRNGATDGSNIRTAISFSANGKINGTFTLTATTTVYLVCYASMDSFTGATSYTMGDIMICSLAAWNVSHKHVPYRPNWDLVETKPQITSNISTAINDFSETRTDLGYVGSSSTITDIASEYVVVRTYKADATLDRRIQIIESAGGVRKTRYYNGTSWGNWT